MVELANDLSSSTFPHGDGYQCASCGQWTWGTHQCHGLGWPYYVNAPYVPATNTIDYTNSIYSTEFIALKEEVELLAQKIDDILNLLKKKSIKKSKKGLDK